MDTATWTIWIAVYGAVISTLALGWNIYKQAASGPKLIGGATYEEKTWNSIPSRKSLFINLELFNRGNSITTVTIIGAYYSKNNMLNNIVETPKFIVSAPKVHYRLDKVYPPFVMEPGEVMEVELLIDEPLPLNCTPYIAVRHSMKNKPVWIHVKKIVEPTQVGK